jgi:hypothetical protein
LGTNSSGKSSILQSLLLLKQSLDEAESTAPVLLPKGRLVNLGNYRELIHGHDTKRQLRFGFRFSSLPYLPVRVAKSIGRELVAADSAGEMPWCTFYIDADKKTGFRLTKYEFGAGSWQTAIADFSRQASELSREERRATQPGTVGRETLLSLGSLNGDHAAVRRTWNAFQGVLTNGRAQGEKEVARAAELVSTFEKASHGPKGKHWQETKRRVETQRSRITQTLARIENYSFEQFIADTITANRRSGLRLQNFLPTQVVVTASVPQAEPGLRYLTPVDIDKDLPSVIHAASSVAQNVRMQLADLVYIGPLREYPERHYIFSGNVAQDVGKSGKFMPDLLFSSRRTLKTLNEWLERFDIPYRLAAKTVRDPEVKDVFSLRLIDRRSNVSVSALDVGFGISQVLPVLVQSILAKRQLVLIEQPEIHLHPRLQAELGSFFAERIRDGEDNQFIIETHSEHLVLRLQRLVREGQLSPDDVAIVSVSHDEGGAQARLMRLDSDGDFIDAWPGGFFPERLRELV